MNIATRILPPEAIAALESGNKVEAIKYVRAENNFSLKEAKDFVETYLEHTPADNVPIKEIKTRKITDIGWLIIAVVVVGFYYIIVGKM